MNNFMCNNIVNFFNFIVIICYVNWYKFIELIYNMIIKCNLECFINKFI